METGKDLLYGGGYAIKEYYMESGNPRQMRGASELLNECAMRVEKLLKDNRVEAKDIFRGGATLSARVPRGTGAEFAKQAELIFRENCRTASAAFVAVPLGKDYAEAKKLALAEYESRKSAKFTDWEFLDDESESESLNYRRITAAERLKMSSKQPHCQRCRLRTLRYEVRHQNGEVQYLCTSCAKREQKSSNRKYDLRKECGERFDYSYEINTTADLADDNGRIALLYADVNNLGGYKHDDFEQDRRFHEGVEKIVKKSVCNAIGQAMAYRKWNKDGTVPSKISSKFEIIALGGDDVCLLLPGDVALFVAKAIIENFDQSVKALSEELDIFQKNERKLTISVAACVAKDKTALTYMEQIVENGLDKKAKKHARTHKKSACCLSFFEKTGELFPMTVEEAVSFMGLLDKAAAISSTALRNIAEAYQELVVEGEFPLYLDYYLSRDVVTIKKSKAILKEIYNHYKGKNPWPDFMTWRDQKWDREVPSDAADES